MPQYRMKAVVEAYQLTAETRASNADWPEWMHKAWNKVRGTDGSLYPAIIGDAGGALSLMTREGVLNVALGDYIIQGVQGKLFSYGPDIFAATFDEVSRSDTSSEPAPVYGSPEWQKAYEEMGGS